MSEATTTKVHPFELAGLGIAPFRFVGAEERRGPISWTENGITLTAGAPGQPMGTCSYCGQGIAVCCFVEDAKGSRFMVGSDCIRKVYSTGTRVRSDLERQIRSMKVAAESERIAAVRERVSFDNDLRDSLAAKPSPNEYRASKGETMLDWADWMLKNAGHTGRMDVTRYVERRFPAPVASEAAL